MKDPAYLKLQIEEMHATEVGGFAEDLATEMEKLEGDIHAILRPIHRGMLQFFGFDVLAPQIGYAPVRMSDQQRHSELERYRVRLAAIAGEPPIDVGHC